jgi:hypothetical protein
MPTANERADPQARFMLGLRNDGVALDRLTVRVPILRQRALVVYPTPQAGGETRDLCAGQVEPESARPVT